MKLKYVCVQECYIDANKDGKQVHYFPGDTEFCDEKPIHFELFGTTVVNLQTASGAEIIASQMTDDDLFDFAYEEFGIELDRSDDRVKLVGDFINARERYVNTRIASLEEE